MTVQTQTQPHILVVGSGVIGLSTALSLLDSPVSVKVTLISSHFPTDNAPAPAEYASAWAGAHHVSSPSTMRERKWDEDTLRVLRALQVHQPWQQQQRSQHTQTQTQQNDPPALLWVRQSELFATSPKDEVEKWTRSALDMYTKSASTAAGHTLFQSSPGLPVHEETHFNTIDINVPVYLSMLFSRFIEMGGRAVRGRVNSVKEAIQMVSLATSDESHAAQQAVSAVFLAPGLGIREFSDVPAEEREKTYPVRGQTLLVHAPWLKINDSDGSEGNPSWAGLSRTNEKGERDLYIIPRGGGQFIVGGTRLPYDDDATPRTETTTAILTRALQLCPLLASPNPIISPRTQDVQILGVNVGFRPARKGGPVLREWPADEGRPCEEKVVLGYGFGGYGYQTSWGVAFEARKLLFKALDLDSAIPDGYGLKSLEDVQTYKEKPSVEHLWRRARI